MHQIDPSDSKLAFLGLRSALEGLFLYTLFELLRSLFIDFLLSFGTGLTLSFFSSFSRLIDLLDSELLLLLRLRILLIEYICLSMRLSTSSL